MVDDHLNSHQRQQPRAAQASATGVNSLRGPPATNQSLSLEKVERVTW